MFQELKSYIYILEEKKGSTSSVICFEPTLAAARKTMDKLVEREKYTLETEGLQEYTSKSPDGKSVSLFRATEDNGHSASAQGGSPEGDPLCGSELVQEKRISVKRVPSVPK